MLIEMKKGKQKAHALNRLFSTTASLEKQFLIISYTRCLKDAKQTKNILFFENCLKTICREKYDRKDLKLVLFHTLFNSVTMGDEELGRAKLLHFVGRYENNIVQLYC